MSDVNASATGEDAARVGSIPAPLFAGAGIDRDRLMSIRHDVADVARDLKLAAEGAVTSEVFVTFWNGSVRVLANPDDLRGLVRPQDVRSIRIRFVYTDGSVISGQPIRGRLPGYLCSDSKPQRSLRDTIYEQIETLSCTKGGRLLENWEARERLPRAGVQSLWRAFLVLIMAAAGAVSFIAFTVGTGEAAVATFVISFSTLALMIYLLFPLNATSPDILGTRLSKSSLVPGEVPRKSWIVRLWKGFMAKFLVAILAATIAAILGTVIGAKILGN